MEAGISIPTLAKSCRNATAVLERTYKTSCTRTHSRAPSACNTDAAIPICGSPFRQAPLCTDHNVEINRNQEVSTCDTSSSGPFLKHLTRCISIRLAQDLWRHSEYMLLCYLQPHGFLVIHLFVQRIAITADGSPFVLPSCAATIITQHAIIPRGAFARSTVQCSTVSRHHPPHYHRFYRALGQRVKQLRKKKGYTQEDMISFGFGLRHWQQIEGGHPINISTLLRICEAFDLRAWQIIRGLDDGFPRSQRRDINPRAR